MTEPNSPWLDVQATYVQPLPACGTATEQVHVYEAAHIDAVNAALAARRPLLVRGEPGTGKSQLALAAAASMKRPCQVQVIDSRTTAQDLLWTFDAVARLATAQLAGALGRLSEDEVNRRLDEKRFVAPGPLWWALAWDTAEKHVSAYGGNVPDKPDGWTADQGAVVLIDEIDKADSDVPNGLLEVLGCGRFKPHGYPVALGVSSPSPPLVVITTNEERALPDAFVRRCLVLHLELPSEPSALEALLIARGKAHFQSASEAVLRSAAGQLIQDRTKLKERRLPAPGQAEYLDLVRAVTALRQVEKEQLELLDKIAVYAMQKHPKDSP